jgi:phosphatidate cytidylyltransferase
MPLNLLVFKTRALTALAFAALVCGALIWHPLSFFILVACVSLGAWLEYFALAEKTYGFRISNPVKTGFLLLTLFGLLYASGLVLSEGVLLEKTVPHLRWFLMIAFFILIMLPLMLIQPVSAAAKKRYLSGLIYITFTLGTLLMIRSNDRQGLLFTAGIIGSIWINDTMAYITGSLIGKTPLSAISPKKTWEGTLGGILLAVITVYLLGRQLPAAQAIAPRHWFFIALISSVLGTIGDLYESRLKRMAQVKDSGNILPGHGGFLDRFDSLLFAAPAVWIYLVIAGMTSVR